MRGASLEVVQYNHSVIGPQPGDRRVLAGTTRRMSKLPLLETFDWLANRLVMYR